MKNLKYILFLLFISCQEEISLDLPQAEEKVVVEGFVENGSPTYIFLTKNLGIYDPYNQSLLNDLFIRDADVTVTRQSDGFKKSLAFIDLNDLGYGNIALYADIEELIAAFDTTNNNLEGCCDFAKEGDTYLLEINWNNKLITATTTIPYSTKLDCVWVEKSNNSDIDYECDIKAVYDDPSGVQNQVLIQTKRIFHEVVKIDEESGQYSVIDSADVSYYLGDARSDIIGDGLKFETVFPKPNEDGLPFDFWSSERVDEESSLSLKGDTVLIKFSQIDEPSYKFWRGLSRQAGTNGNPFAEPLNLVSNIEGGLGIWTGYGTVYYKIPITPGLVIYQNYIPRNINEVF